MLCLVEGRHKFMSIAMKTAVDDYYVFIEPAEIEKSYISCPFPITFLIWLGKDSAECAGTNQVAVMSYFSSRVRSLSMPTVAPNMPLDTSVGFAGAPVLVFSLIEYQPGHLADCICSVKMYQPETASTSIPYPINTLFGIVEINKS